MLRVTGQVKAGLREHGWAIVEEELEAGLLSASAPVRGRTGQVVAALASSTSAGRSTRGELERDVVPTLVDTARRITAELVRG